MQKDDRKANLQRAHLFSRAANPGSVFCFRIGAGTRRTIRDSMEGTVPPEGLFPGTLRLCQPEWDSALSTACISRLMSSGESMFLAAYPTAPASGPKAG